MKPEHRTPEYRNRLMLEAWASESTRNAQAVRQVRERFDEDLPASMQIRIVRLMDEKK